MAGNLNLDILSVVPPSCGCCLHGYGPEWSKSWIVCIKSLVEIVCWPHMWHKSILTHCFPHVVCLQGHFARFHVVLLIFWMSEWGKRWWIANVRPATIIESITQDVTSVLWLQPITTCGVWTEDRCVHLCCYSTKPEPVRSINPPHRAPHGPLPLEKTREL